MTIYAGIGMMGPDERKNQGLVFGSPRASINPMRGKRYPVSLMLKYDVPE